MSVLWKNPAVRANPLVQLFADYVKSEIVTDDLVILNGDGFGPAPNVVAFRTFAEGVEGERLQAMPPAGEIGVFHSTSPAGLPYYGVMNGRPSMFMQDDSIQGSRQAAILFPKPTRRFRIFCKMGVPVGTYFPGGYENPSHPKVFHGFPRDSSAKLIWVQSAAGAGNYDPNICVPTHIGRGALVASGNGIKSVVQWSGAEQGHDVWDWDVMNGIGYAQDCDPVDPGVNPARVEGIICNDLITSKKPTKTHSIVSTTETPFLPSGQRQSTLGPYAPEECWYVEARIGGWVRWSEGCQMAFRDLYIATESEEGAGDWNQCIFLGNAANFSDCTDLICVPPELWTPTEIRFKRRPGYTHYHVIKPDNSMVSGSLT